MNFGLKTRIQKITAIVLVMAMMIAVFQIGGIVTYAYDAKTGMIAPADRAMVETKASPSVDAEKVSGLLYGKPVTVINETIDAAGVKWYEVKYFIQDGAVEKTGFCQASNILLDENASITATGKVNANNVSLWSCTGQYKAPKLATFNAGTKLEILDEHVDSSKKWYRVRYKGETATYIGWMESDYVTKDPVPEIETDEEYEIRICGLKDEFDLSWDDIAAIINTELGQNYTESRYRKMWKAYCLGVKNTAIQKRPRNKQEGEYLTYDNNISKTEEEKSTEFSDYIQQKIELQKERVKVSDERIQANAYIRALAREETIKEIALECAKEMNSKKMLEAPRAIECFGGNAAILQLSDIHYGLIVDNYWNKYNPDIAKEKIAQLRDKVIKYCKLNDVSDLYITELGDAIAGRIHETIRYQSRFDVITQIMQISEIIAEMITDLAQYFNIHYYCCLDNHSRLEPNKKAALDLESLARIIPWYLKERVGDFVEVNDNKYGEDIITFKCKGFNIAGCHGDKDSPIKIVDNLSMMTRENFDMVLTAHLHHFSADEKNQILVISNPSILSTDDYSKNLRLSSKSAQNLIIVSDENVMECLYRIVLN